MEKITFCLEDGEVVEFYVLEQTRLGGVDYILVTDSDDDDGEALILKDVSAPSDTEACYEIVEDDNELDAVAAISAAHRLGTPVSQISDAVVTFSGIARRIQPLGTIRGRAVYYDYAHHPREIENTLSVLCRRHGGVDVIFRPHTYSRTAAFLDGFRASLSIADAVALIDVYAARESEADGIPSSRLAEHIGSRAALVDPTAALDYILTHSCGAIVLMGAGEVDGILNEIKRRLDAPTV